MLSTEFTEINNGRLWKTDSSLIEELLNLKQSKEIDVRFHPVLVS